MICLGDVIEHKLCLRSRHLKEPPITVQVLGVCSALAVTAKLKPAFVMYQF